MNNLILISNRLPFRIEKKGGRHELKQSSGGLVSALQSLSVSGKRLTWIGTADFREQSWQKVKDSASTPMLRIEPVFADQKTYNLYYDNCSNGMIWPLFHYFPSYAEYSEDAYQAYREMNRLFAEKALETAMPGDTIWIHDYHLMLLPKLIREKMPSVNIGFFLHIPFPSYEIFRLIPAEWREEILEGLLQSDLLGFHTPEYLSHFKKTLACFTNVHMNNNTASLHDHECHIGVYPISIDFAKFNGGWDEPAVRRARTNLKKNNEGVKIIFSVDRLDYTKGVMNRLLAYEKLLETEPRLHGKVVFLINVVPSRDQINKYAERKKMIEENIGRINGLYGSMSWQPLVYQYRHLSFHQLLSFYTSADIALVTPLRDGMNLVAKEFVASRKDKRGVLILSELAGAAAELKEAILVNPNDLVTMKQGILQALDLPEEEQRMKMEAMQRVLKDNDISKWTDSFLNDLANVSSSHLLPPRVMSFDERKEISDCYGQSSKRLLLFDYDGSLVPYYIRPEDAKPSDRLIELLSELNHEPGNELIIISGRDSATLEEWFGKAGIAFVGEHGALYKKPDAPLICYMETSSGWRKDVEDIFQRCCQKYEGAFVEKKTFSLGLHFRAVNNTDVASLKTEVTRELLMLDSNNSFNILSGNMIIEAKSNGMSKGSFVSRMLDENHYDFILAIGDDTTDEDMFSSLYTYPHAHTIKVGIAPTRAKCNLINVNSLLSFLEQLNRIRSVAALRQKG